MPSSRKPDIYRTLFQLAKRFRWGLALGLSVLAPMHASAQANSPETSSGQNGQEADKKQQAAGSPVKSKAVPADKAQDASKTQGAANTSPAEQPDRHPPSVTGGTPTVTDTAALNLPGWVECDPGSLKDTDRDRNFGTPLTLKLTSGNQRLQYRLSADGYVSMGNGVNSYGDTYVGLHYLLAPQEKAGFDTAARFTLKIPTADPSIGGTKKFDYDALLLASRDFTKWGLHGDFNLGLSSLSRSAAGGTDTQYLMTGSLTVPIRGGRWQYTNELVYFSPIAGQRERITTMHGFAYSMHRFEVYSAALQWKLHGDGANLQVLVSASFFLTKLF